MRHTARNTAVATALCSKKLHSYASAVDQSSAVVGKKLQCTFPTDVMLHHVP
jgi:hypothetical protein